MIWAMKFHKRSISPQFPWGLLVGPKRIQCAHIAQGIHGLPETVVAIGHQFTIFGKAAHGFEFEISGIALDVLHNAGFEREKTSTDPIRFTCRLLGKSNNLIAFYCWNTKLRRLADNCECRKPAV